MRCLARPPASWCASSAEFGWTAGEARFPFRPECPGTAIRVCRSERWRGSDGAGTPSWRGATALLPRRGGRRPATHGLLRRNPVGRATCCQEFPPASHGWRAFARHDVLTMRVAKGRTLYWYSDSELPIGTMEGERRRWCHVVAGEGPPPTACCGGIPMCGRGVAPSFLQPVVGGGPSPATTCAGDVLPGVSSSQSWVVGLRSPRRANHSSRQLANAVLACVAQGESRSACSPVPVRQAPRPS